MNDDALIRLVDDLEEKADRYVTLEEVERAAGRAVTEQIAQAILLVDYRHGLDGTPVTQCRLNRHHPRVATLTGW